MKKFLVFMLFAVLCVNNTFSQSYAENKLNYDYRFYTPNYSDLYDPTICGVASFFIPGLGQIIAGETGRGMAFLGASLGCGLVYMGSGMYFLAEVQYGEVPVTSLSVMVLSLAASSAITIWSIVDATQVAKVNNMYMQDLRRKNDQSSIESIRLTPYVDRLSINNEVVTPVGLKLSVTF